MRHVRSIVYALLLAAAVWVFCGAGFGDGGTGTGVRNYPLLLLAGVVYAILLFVPISPVGPLVAGVVYFAASIWALASPSSYANLWPAGVTWADLSLPGQGLAAVLAVPMFALSARRQTDPIFRWPARTPPAARPPGPAAAGSETAVPRVSDPDSTAIVIDVEQTQLVRAPEPPAPELARLVPELVSEGPVVQARSAEETMVIRQPSMTPSRPADETMATPRPEAMAPADVTQVMARDLGGDRQVIKPLPSPDAEQTQVVKLPVPLPPAPTPPAQAEASSGQIATPPTPADPAPAPPATPLTPPDPHPTPAATPPAQADEPPETPLTPASTPPGQIATTSAPADRTSPPEATPSANSEAQPTSAATPLAQADARPATSPTSADADASPLPVATPSADADASPPPAPTPPAQADPPPTPPRSAVDGEQTQVIRIAAAEPDRVRPQSIAGSERPDPTADPTTRLRRPAEPDKPSEPPTATPDEPEPPIIRRPRSATELERPADEADDDTRRLRIPTIPAPRRQHDDEAG